MAFFLPHFRKDERLLFKEIRKAFLYRLDPFQRPDAKKIRSVVRIQKIKMVVGDGFEPSKAWPVDLQSTAFDRSATPPDNCAWSG